MCLPHFTPNNCTKYPLDEDCLILKSQTDCVENYTNGSLYNNSRSAGFIEPIIPMLALFFSTIFVILLIFRIGKQLKFQAVANITNLKSNIRIVIVFSIQTIILMFLFCLEFLNELDKLYIIDLKKWPYWAQWLTNDDHVMPSFRELRVFIDSIVVLAFMNGYREDLCDAILWIYRIPKRIWKRIENLKILKKKNSIISLHG